MAGKTSIANPVVVLGLDAGPFTAGLEKAKQAGSAASKKISEAAKGGPKLPTPSAAPRAASGAASGGGILGGVAGAGGILSAVKAPMVALAAANQVFELGAKINKVLGAPIRALMDREQMGANVTGTIDTATSNTFTAGIARFADQFNVMLADIAVALDNTFDLKGKLEYARGALSGISALLTAFFGNLEPIVKDPEALTKQFKAGALMVVNVFEWAATESKKIYDNVVSALDSFGINIKLINDVFSGVITALKALIPNKNQDPKSMLGIAQDSFAAGAAGLIGLVKAAVGVNTKDAFALLNNVRADRRANIALWDKGGGGGGLAMPGAGGPMAIGQGPNIAGVAQGARNAINAAGFIPPAAGAMLIARQADVIMGKIGGSLGNLGGMIASQIAPAITAGTAQLDEAMVKATLQGQQGDIQQRIETEIKAQTTIQKNQEKLLGQIRQAIAGRPDLAILGGV